MERAADKSSNALGDAPVDLIGEIDQAGIDVLAEMLIEAARRRLEDNSENTVESEDEL